MLHCCCCCLHKNKHIALEARVLSCRCLVVSILLFCALVNVSFVAITISHQAMDAIFGDYCKKEPEFYRALGCDRSSSVSRFFSYFVPHYLRPCIVFRSSKLRQSIAPVSSICIPINCLTRAVSRSMTSTYDCRLVVGPLGL